MSEATGEDAAGRDERRPAGDKLTAAFDLLTSAFQDSRIDSITLTKHDLLEQVVIVQQVLNTAWALQTARLAQAAAIEVARLPDATSPDGARTHQIHHAIGTHQDEFIGCEIGPMLGWTSGQAIHRVSESADAITRTPRLFQRVGTGELEPAKLTRIHRALGRVAREVDDDGNPVTLDLARSVEGALLGDPDDSDAAETEQANVDLLARSSAAQAQRRTGRILASLDPIADRKAATRRRRSRVGVFAHPDDEPGLSQLHATLPSAVTAKVMAAVDAHARDLHSDTRTGKTLPECRADAIADLILGNANVTTHLVVQVPVHVGADTEAAHACDDEQHAAGSGSVFRPAAASDTDCSVGSTSFVHPVTGLTVFPDGLPPASTTTKARSQDEVDREFNDLLKRLYPPGPDDFDDWVFSDDYEPSDPRLLDDRLDEAPRHSGTSGRSDGPPGSARVGDAIVPGIGVIAASVLEAMARSFGSTITRALVDAETGVTMETSETRYRPSKRLRRFVEARDGHCRFPGCSRAARWCDLDHVIPSPAGPTAAYNVQCLCRHHHRTKQAHGWSVSMTTAGICTWISPGGRSYVTTPGD